jgi:hypothetical protein
LIGGRISIPAREELDALDPIIIHAALRLGRPSKNAQRAKQILANVIGRELRRPGGGSAAGLAKALDCSERTVWRLDEANRRSARARNHE